MFDINSASLSRMVYERLSSILFLDIETVSGVSSYNELDDRLKKQWERKASFIRKADESDEELYSQRAGIYAEFGRVVCIAIGIVDTSSSTENPSLHIGYFTSQNEKEVLKGVKELMDERLQKDKELRRSTLLCAHNGKEFDFPYLARRMLINGISLPVLLNTQGKKPWEVAHLDTMELWKFGDYKHYTSLDLLTAIFGISSSKNEMDGSQVNEVFYLEKDLEKIVQYCARDVVGVVQLYMKMQNLELIDESCIHIRPAKKR